MNFLDNLFIIKEIFDTEDGFTATVETNPDHPVYQAHFPGNPITPGACIIQFTGTLLEHKLNCKPWLKTIKNVKFLSSIVPEKGKEVKFLYSHMTKEPTECKVQVVVADDKPTIFTKMTLVFGHE